MFEYLEKLRQKPKEERRRFAFFFSAGLTGIFVLVWLVTIPISYVIPEEERDSREGKGDVSSFKEISANVRQAFTREWQAFQNSFDTSGATSTDLTSQE